MADTPNTLGTLMRTCLIRIGHLADRLTTIESQLAEIRTTTLSTHRKATLIMSEQSHIDADVQSIEAQVTAIGTAVTAVAAEIAALKTQPPAAAIDFTGLDKAVADLTSAAGGVAGLENPPKV
jgi:hypothetical protein